MTETPRAIFNEALFRTSVHFESIRTFEQRARNLNATITRRPVSVIASAARALRASPHPRIGRFIKTSLNIPAANFSGGPSAAQPGTTQSQTSSQHRAFSARSPQLGSLVSNKQGLFFTSDMIKLLLIPSPSFVLTMTEVRSEQVRVATLRQFGSRADLPCGNIRERYAPLVARVKLAGLCGRQRGASANMAARRRGNKIGVSGAL